MIHYQQRDALYFCRFRESQYRLAGPVRSDAVILPALFGRFALRVDDLQRAFVALRLRRRAALSFVDDLSRVVLKQNDENAYCEGDDLIHIQKPRPANPELPTRQV